MGEATKLLRTSIHAFFHSYHFYTSVAGLLVLPVSASILFSQALTTSSPEALRFISSRLRSLLEAASFPDSSLFNLMLSRTIFTSVFALPFTLTFLVLAKASVALRTAIDFPVRRQQSHVPPPSPSLLRLYFPLLLTHLFSSFLVLSANAAMFSLLFLLLNAAGFVGLSSTTSRLAVSLAGAFLYSIAVGNTILTCNLAAIVSAAENCGGYLPVLEACVLIRGRVATALSIALPTNLAMAAVEALFQFRVMRPYRASGELRLSIASEGFTIAYIHSVLVVLEIIGSCLFYKSCRREWGEDQAGRRSVGARTSRRQVCSLKHIFDLYQSIQIRICKHTTSRCTTLAF